MLTFPGMYLYINVNHTYNKNNCKLLQLQFVLLFITCHGTLIKGIT